VALGGRVLAPCRAVLPPPAGSAILPPRDTAVGTCRHGVPTAMEFDARFIFLEIFGLTIYFSKIKEKKYI
jgi:hypothetical protein